MMMMMIMMMMVCLFTFSWLLFVFAQSFGYTYERAYFRHTFFFLNCGPGSLSPRGGRSFDECVDDMQRAEELKNARFTSQGSGSGGGGWSSAEDEEADPVDQDNEGPPLQTKQTLTFIFFCLISCFCFYAKTHRFGR